MPYRKVRRRIETAGLAPTSRDGAGRSQGAGSPRMLLRIGSRGASVERLQEAVGAKVDGVFGPETDRVVRAFQRDHGLTPDGVVGPVTRRALPTSLEVAGSGRPDRAALRRMPFGEQRQALTPAEAAPSSDKPIELVLDWSKPTPPVEVGSDVVRPKKDFGSAVSQVLTFAPDVREEPDKFVATVRVDLDIDLDVHPGNVAPENNQLSIDSAADPDICADNWPTIVRDLTPRAYGKPDRESFWARDITIDHERVHEADAFDVSNRLDRNWKAELDGARARTQAQAEARVAASSANKAATFSAMLAPETEVHPAVAPLYRARVDAIRLRGAAGEYGQCIHTVKAGEWLAKIAEMYGVDLRRLLRENHHLGPPTRSYDRIYPGDQVRIPSRLNPTPNG